MDPEKQDTTHSERRRSIVDEKELAIEKLHKDEITQEILDETIEGTLPDPFKQPDEFLVTFEGRPHLNPHSWSSLYKWFLTFFAGFFYFNSTFASSAPSNIIPELMEHYHFSQEVGILTVALFVAGYCVGPLLWGPLSERRGRREMMIISFVIYTGFTFGSAFAPNTGALIIFRFLSGCFASSAIPIAGAIIADTFEPEIRGSAIGVFSVIPFAGPAVSPIMSGFIHVRRVDFHWVFYVLCIFSTFCTALIIFFLPETHHGTILSREAKRLRKTTGDDRWHSALEVSLAHDGGVKNFLNQTILKPVIMLIEEPMLNIMSLYMAFIYGVIYLFFEAIPIIFEQGHGLNAGKTGLIFLSLPLGGVTSVTTYVLYFNRRYQKLCAKTEVVPPEARLFPVLFSSPLYAIAMFWLAFTSYPSISIWSPIVSLYVNGFALSLVFLGSFNYIIDTYFINAASALSIATVVRSAFGAGFPLFANQMYKRLGTVGACALLAGVATLFVPFPFIFARYGKIVRSWSKNAYI